MSALVPGATLTGMGLGLVAGAGLVMIMVGVPVARRPRLADRLAPHLRDVPRGSRLLGQHRGFEGQWALVLRLFTPALASGGRLHRLLDALAGGSTTTSRRLRQAGSSTTLEQFRAEQLVLAVIGLLVGTGLAGLLTVTRGSPPAALALLVLVTGGAGAVARDVALSRAVARRTQRILTEFPTVAELLALSVAAGEGAVGALERIASTSSGELSGELRATLAHARAGAPLVTALEGLASRTAVPALGRFVDGMAVALERGTPLTEVLRAQAQDVRELSRRQLMEAGGRKEIQMMIPVVFLVLPVTVLFAVFPGAAVLTGAR